MLIALLQVGLDHSQILARIAHASKPRQTARIIRLWKSRVRNQSKSLRRKQLRIDRIARVAICTEWTAQVNCSIALAGRRSKVREIAGEHFGGGNICHSHRGSRVLNGGLLAAKN